MTFPEDQTEATADTTTAAVEATQEEPTKRENRAVKTADIPEKTYKMAFIDENLPFQWLFHFQQPLFRRVLRCH